MKSILTTTPGAPDWSRAKSLLGDLKFAVRRSLSAQILIGKELAFLKSKYTHGGNRRVSSPQFAVLNQGPNSWKALCESELGTSDDAANRWIACFQYALERAKAHKAKFPDTLRLLEIPAAELTGDELDALAKHVERLVKADDPLKPPLTQAKIMEELKIGDDGGKLKGGDTSQHRKKGEPVPFEVAAADFFGDITREFGSVRKSIFRGSDGMDYLRYLEGLPLDSPEPRHASLISIKEELEGILNGDLAKVIRAVDAAIAARMHGPAPKRSRKPKPVTSRK